MCATDSLVGLVLAMSTTTATTTTTTATTTTSDQLIERDAGQGSGRRRRRRPRFRRRPGGDRSEDPASPEAPNLDNVEAMVIHAAPAPEEQAVPPCIIDWSDRIARAEHDLEHAVIVTVIGASPLSPVPAVAGVLAANLDVNPSSLVLRRASSSSYLLMLLDLSSVTRLVNLKQLLRSPEFSLLCKKSGLPEQQGKYCPVSWTSRSVVSLLTFGRPPQWNSS